MTRLGPLMLLFATVWSAAGSAGTSYYVAPNGDDANPGSIERPFATIQHGASRLEAGDVLYVRGGRYHESVRLDGLNGRAGEPIRIRAYPGESVLLDGSVRISTEWSRHEGAIFRARLDQDVWQLFVGDETMISARWPNARWEDGSIWDQERTWAHQASESTYGRMVNDPEFQDLAGAGVDFTDAIVILNIGAWNTFATRVTSHERGSGSFTYPTDLWERLARDDYWELRRDHSWYFLEGSLEMLDAPGEWVYQPASKSLYFWPPDGNAPDGLEIRGKVLTYALQIDNSSHVVIEGLDFFAATFRIGSSHHVTVQDATLKYPSYSRRMLGITGIPEVTVVEGSDNTIRNCTFAYTDGEALVIEGERNLIENNYFHDINYSAVGPAVTIDSNLGTETVFRRNTVHRGGASVGLRAGPRNVIEYNDIYDIGHLQGDGALIQLSPANQPGTVIRYNWLHESAQASRFIDPKYGLRFDGSFIGYLAGERVHPHSGTVHHNVVWGTRSLYIKGDSHGVFHNLSFDNVRSDIAVRSGVGNPVPRNPLEGFEYPGYGPGIDHPEENDGTVTRNNLAGEISSKLGAPSLGLPGRHSNNWAGDVRTQLRDPDHLDFRPRPESRLIDAGFYVDGITGEPVGAAPDIGPYEAGADRYWIPGMKRGNASTPIPPDGATGVRADADLMWLEGYRAVGHEVYFGTDRNAVAEADASRPEYQGSVESNILELERLQPGETYFWRVDVLLGSEKVKGAVWRFTVEH